jgi:hypothetical protein
VNQVAVSNPNSKFFDNEEYIQNPTKNTAAKNNGYRMKECRRGGEKKKEEGGQRR